MRLGHLLVFAPLLLACDQTPKGAAPAASTALTSASAPSAASVKPPNRDDATWTAISQKRADADWPKPGRYEKTLVVDEKERGYLVQIPLTYVADKKASLLFMLHGEGGSPAQSASRDPGIALAAARAGYIAVFPEGSVKDSGGHTWNDGLCADEGAEKADEVGFFRKLIAQLSTDLTVDAQRIFVMGFASGGRMTQRLGAELADQLAAIVPIAGLSICQREGGEKETIPTPKEPMSALMFFGKKDPSIPFDGGKNDKGLDVGSVADMTKLWTDAANCEERGEKKGRPDDPVRTLRYECPETGREVLTIILNKEGHILPTRVGNKPVMDIVTHFLNGQTRKAAKE